MHTPPTVYIRLRKRIAVPVGYTIRLGEVAQIVADPDIEQALRDLPLLTTDGKDGSIVLVDMLRIAKAIRERFPGTQIELFGDPHVIVDIRTGEKAPRFALIAFVWLLLFVGSGLAIMNFHEDVSMMEVHRTIYEMITGRKSEHPYLLQIPYSIGLGAGMVLFFNQLFKKKFSEEPSPLEVEMFSYQENLNRYVVAEEYKKMHESNPTP